MLFAFTFDWQAVIDTLPRVLVGTQTTILVTVLAIVLSVALALLIAVARLGRNSAVRATAFLFTQFFRGVAFYVLVVWVFFGMQLVIDLRLEPFVAGLLSLTLLSSAYLAEIFRSSIVAVDDGQREGAVALGLGGAGAFFWVITPQAARVALPAVGNQFTHMLKDSAILAVIGVRELMFETQRMTGMDFKPFEHYTTAMFIYIALVGILSISVNKLEDYLAPDQRAAISRPSSGTDEIDDDLTSGVTI